MKVAAIISIVEFAGATTLAGRASGVDWFMHARSRVENGPPGIHALSFEGVRVATVSWLREAVISLQRSISVTRPDIRLVVVSLSDLVREELSVALDASNSAMIAATLSAHDELADPAILGRLDAALSETLNATRHFLEFSASHVSKALPHVALTAANNRLVALESKGILQSRKSGRMRLFRRFMENLSYG